MKRKIVNGSLYLGIVLITFVGCRRDTSTLVLRNGEKGGSTVLDSMRIDTTVVYDTIYTYDTIPNFDSTFVYDSSLILTDRSDWAVIDSSSATGNSNDITESWASEHRNVHALFDGKLKPDGSSGPDSRTGYYHSGNVNINSGKTIELFPLPHWFIIDMGRPQKVASFFYIGRGAGPEKQTPKTVHIFATNDLSKLTTFDVSDSSATVIVDNKELPDHAEQKKQDTIWIDNGQSNNVIDSFQYFRFEITENWDNGIVSNFAELGIKLQADKSHLIDTVLTPTEPTLIPIDSVVVAIDTVYTLEKN